MHISLNIAGRSGFAPVVPANAASIDPTSLFVDVFAGTNNPGGMAPGQMSTLTMLSRQSWFPRTSPSRAAILEPLLGLKFAQSGERGMGDLDTAPDGDDHGMAKFNQQATSQEFTDPVIKIRPSLRFSQGSATEMTDSEAARLIRSKWPSRM